MTTSTNIKINIVEPGSPTPTPTPVDPSTTGTTDISVPDTGLFTHGIGAPEATIIAVSVVLILAIAAIVSLRYKKKTNKKTESATEVAHKSLLSKITKFTTFGKYMKSNKKISIPLVALALVVSLGTLAALLVNAGKGNTNAIEPTEGNEVSTLTLDVESEELTIEVGDEPVFAYLPVKLTVEEATQAGYTLTAYTDSTDIVSVTNPDNIIPMVTVDESELAALTDNTYGLSLSEPASQDDKTFTALSTDTDAPTFITDKDYEETEANDTITIYYGFYITPDTPYGTYEGSKIKYTTKANRTDLAKVTFDGNGLYFNNNSEQTTNTVRYEVVATTETEKYSHTPNITDAGVQNGSYPLGDARTSVVTIPGASSLHVNMTYGDGIGYYADDYVCFWSGAIPTMTATSSNCESGVSVEGANNGKYIFNTKYDPTPKNTIEADINDNSSVTFAYVTTTNSGGSGEHTGYGYYAVVTGYDENGNPVYLDKNIAVVGNYEEPSSSDAYRFLGWSTDQSATTATYSNADDIMNNLSISAGGEVILYAVWQPIVEITYDGNGADATTNMDNVKQFTTDLISTDKQVDLLASNFTKEGYGFVGWSTDANAWDNLVDADPANDPTIYGPNQTITIDEDLIAEAGEDRKLILNAVWAPAETTASGDKVFFQNWQGCSALTPTEYNTETGIFIVGKNTVTALTDKRDGNIYTVARLVDGNCWMIENLRLDNEPELSSANTHNPLLPLTNDSAEESTSNRLSASSDEWCTNLSDNPCLYQSKLNTNNTVETTMSPVFKQDFTSSRHQSFEDSIYSYGNYYNWYSATAGNGKQDVADNVTVAGDICPSGWQLPYGGRQDGSEEGYNKGDTNGGFYYLNRRMSGNTSERGSNNWRTFPNNLIYSGYWRDYYVGNLGNIGQYWSSTADDISQYGSITKGAFVITLYDRDLEFESGRYTTTRASGFTVRCLTLAE